MFRHITLPLVLPFIMVALVIRTIDALKAFDTIFVITQGGPGTASETINIYLYLQAFAFYNIGYASAVVVVFFVIIVALSLLLLWVRQRTQWTLDDMKPSLRRAFAHSPAFGLKALARKLGFALAVFVIVSPAILVFLWMLSLSLKNELDNTAYPPVFIPSRADAGTTTSRCSSRTRSCSTPGTARSSPASSTLVGAAGRRAGRLRHRQGARRRARGR